jgi:hypothetical protein
MRMTGLDLLPRVPPRAGRSSPLGQSRLRLVSHDDLPYLIEVWDAASEDIEAVVAMTLSASVGFAAYYAAAREHPGRTITLRHDGRIVSRWSPVS